MSGFSKVILIGNLVRDPELRYTPSGKAVSDVRVAITTRRAGGGRGGDDSREDTVFIDITLWERQAEFVNEWFSKGKPIMVEGRLIEDTWQDKETGEKRSRIKIMGERIQFLPRDSGSGGQGGGQGGYAPASRGEGGEASMPPPRRSAPPAAPQQGRGSQGGGAPGRGAPSRPAESFDDDFGAGAPPADDIPF